MRIREFKLNEMRIPYEEFILMMRRVYEDNKILPFDEIGYDDKTNRSGIKLIPYFVRRLLLYNRDSSMSNWVYSSADEYWIKYDEEKGIWVPYTEKGIRNEFIQKWYEIMKGFVLNENQIFQVLNQYSNYATICNEIGSTIYNLFNEEMIPMKNGIYNRSTNEFRKYRKSDFCLNRLACNYNPSLPKSEFFEDFLDRALQPDHKEIQKDCIYAFLGSLIRGYNLDQWIMMLLAKKGGTGKGTLANIFGLVLGEDNVTSMELKDFSEDTHSTSQILGKHLILISEMAKGKLKNLSAIKSISGGDPIRFNPKNKQPFSKKPKGQMLLLGNTVTEISVEEVAFWRRPIILEFSNTPYTIKEYVEFQKQISKQEEIDKIANTALKYLPRTKQIQSEYHNVFDSEEEYHKITKERIWTFLRNFIRDGKDSNAQISTKFLIDLYNIYLESEGFQKIKVNQSMMSRFGGALSSVCNQMKIRVFSKQVKDIYCNKRVQVHEGFIIERDMLTDLRDWCRENKLYPEFCEFIEDSFENRLGTGNLGEYTPQIKDTNNINIDEIEYS